eukprot:1136171-Pelagomonas_calceolata.AAC.3
MKYAHRRPRMPKYLPPRSDARPPAERQKRFIRPKTAPTMPAISRLHSKAVAIVESQHPSSAGKRHKSKELFSLATWHLLP